VALLVVAVGVPLLTQGPLVERDLRWRTHGGVLARTYLDALLGLLPLRAHVADRAVRSEHDRLLVEWTRTGRSVQRLAALSDGLQALLTLALVAALVVSSVARGVGADVGLLVLFWAMTLPALGLELAAVLRRWPTLRNSVLRLVEPLTAELVDVDLGDPGSSTHGSGPVSLELRDVVVEVGGHRILDGIDVHIEAGEHVALVGPSGAGKSTLVALPLGFHRPSEGALLVDGTVCDAERLAALRSGTVWLDPEVALWNRSLADNLRYDHDVDPERSGAVRTAGLEGVVGSLSGGLDEVIGESGGLLSGGQGQRVRLGRALGVPTPRLVVLDEPFRGLDREQRHDLLRRARGHWAGATLLCVTHDVNETLDFDRVLVVDDGVVVEDGAPAVLAGDTSSRYRALLEAEERLRSGGWGSVTWRRWRLVEGRLQEGPEPQMDGSR
jgi:ATP-binding cassette subfamily B protein